MVDCLSAAYKEGGVRGLFRGAGARGKFDISFRCNITSHSLNLMMVIADIIFFVQ